jgi:hypothetical protein
MSLTLYDFRDLDLMLKIADLGDNEGWVTTAELASSLGLDDQLASVAIRCSWMKRYGMLDFDPAKRNWRLSESGMRIVAAKSKASAIKSIEAVPDVSMIDVMAHVTARYRLGDSVMATMLRREFQYGTSPRSSIWSK